MKLAWLTDIHLNACTYDQRMAFYDKIKDACVANVLITGDIGSADSFRFYINELSQHINKSVYFVLGNHDYYNSSVEAVRGDIEAFRHLSQGPAELTDGVYLVGQDCWADGRNGNYAQSHVRLNDSKYIKELKDAYKLDFMDMALSQSPDKKGIHLLTKMQELADADAGSLEGSIEYAIECGIRYKRPATKILIAMHVPPFAENAYYNGKMSDDDYLPFFSSKVTGDMLMRVCAGHPDVEFQGYCGHSHGKSVYQPLPNLIVKCGEAEYGNPVIQEIIEI